MTNAWEDKKENIPWIQLLNNQTMIQVKICGGPYTISRKSKPHKHKNVCSQVNNNTTSNPYHVSNKLNNFFLKPTRNEYWFKRLQAISASATNIDRIGTHQAEESSPNNIWTKLTEEHCKSYFTQCRSAYPPPQIHWVFHQGWG